jgi:hypothetical protein
VNWPGPDCSAFYGVGLFTAARTTFPLSQSLCLELKAHVPPEAGEVTSRKPDAHRMVSSEEVTEINQMTMNHAHSHIVLPGVVSEA